MSFSDSGHELERLLAQRAQPDSVLPFHPIMYRLQDSAQQQQLQALLATNLHIQVLDQLDQQLRELVSLRSPARKLKDAEINERVQAHLGGVPPALYGVWVYYPWAQRVVHLLDRQEFSEVRTNRNLYKITPAERALLQECRVGVVGLSVGQSIALTMAMERSFGEIRLADFDQLDLSNLNRIRSGVHHLGVPKVVLAAREIAEIDPFLTVKCFAEGISEANIDSFIDQGGRLDLLVDECDSLDIKLLLRHRARAYGIPVIMDTSDRGLLDVERFDQEPELPILHGLVGNLHYTELQGLTNEEKIVHVLKIIGLEDSSMRLKASMLEIESSISTWPQLASAVVLGGAVGADVGRRIMLGQAVASGRYYIDLEELVPSSRPPASQRPLLTDQAIGETAMADAIQSFLDTTHSTCLPMGPDPLVELVEAGIAAPSGGNAQPWIWAATDGHLFLFLDAQRASTLLDYQSTASLLALGAAIENVVLHTHRLGYEVAVQLFPVDQEQQLVASFCFLSADHAQRQQPEAHLADDLAAFIHQRHTNRAYGSGQEIAPAIKDQLIASAATIPGAVLHWRSAADEIQAADEIIGRAERLRMLHPQMHAETMSEVRWTTEEAAISQDGIDLQTFPLTAIEHVGFALARDRATINILAHLNLGHGLIKLANKTISSSAAICLLTMPQCAPADYVMGGRAMQRVWLEATRQNLAIQPNSALPYMFVRLIRGADTTLTPIAADLHELRERYTRLFPVDDHIGEMLLFRVSMTDQPAIAAYRRPVAEVLRWI